MVPVKSNCHCGSGAAVWDWFGGSGRVTDTINDVLQGEVRERFRKFGRLSGSGPDQDQESEWFGWFRSGSGAVREWLGSGSGVSGTGVVRVTPLVVRWGLSLSLSGSSEVSLGGSGVVREFPAWHFVGGSEWRFQPSLTEWGSG